MIFTFGGGQTRPTGESLADHYIDIPIADFWAARAEMVRLFGQTWAFQYDTFAEARIDEWPVAHALDYAAECAARDLQDAL